MRRPADSIVRALACSALLAACHAQAQNLLRNPGFDHDLDGWTHTLGVAHVADDGWPAPGALRISSDSCCTRLAHQCVAVTGGVRYDLAAALRRGAVAPGQAGDGIGIDIYWYDNPDCEWPPLPGGAELAPELSTAWAMHLLEGARAPDEARSAVVRVRQYNFAALGGLLGFADSVVLQATPMGVFRDGFESLPD